MSESKQDYESKFDAAVKAEADKLDLQAKEAEVRKHRANVALDQIKTAEDEMNRAANLNLDRLSPEQIVELRKQNADYMEAAKYPITFINPEFVKLVPSFRKNIILIGAVTGAGKSTAVANIAAPIIFQKKKSDQKLGRVLVMTNEEKSEDVYNRVTCLAQGWSYTNHSDFTDEQKKVFDQWIAFLSQEGRLTVVDDNYGGVCGTTTTLEGIKGIFENLIKNKIFYDAIIIDYYQNVQESKLDPNLDQYKVQARLSRMLDHYKNIYPAPIYVFIQLEPSTSKDGNKKIPFRHRIEGRKVILNVSTACIEMVADKENLSTEFYFHKSRFTQFNGESITMDYVKGKFVKQDKEARRIRDALKEQALADAAKLGSIGLDGKDIKPVDDDKKKE